MRVKSRIIEALEEHKNLTLNELVVASGLTNTQVNSGLTHLKNLGLINQDTKRVCRGTGRWSTQYQLKNTLPEVRHDENLMVILQTFKEQLEDDLAVYAPDVKQSLLKTCNFYLRKIK